jgi:hypothetical protein
VTWAFVIAATLFGVAAIRTIVHDHHTDRALLPWAWTLLAVAAACIHIGWALFPA